MTAQERTDKFNEILDTTISVIDTFQPALVVGAIVSPPIAGMIASAAQLTKTLAKLARGEEPTGAELAHADAEREASAARMNAAAALALAQAES